jgi:hypothetical protein
MTVSLSYTIEYSDFFIPEYPLTGELATDGFVARLSGTDAEVELLAAFATQEEARQFVEPYLHAWEMAAAALRGWPVFRFRFRAAQIPRVGGGPGFTATMEIRMSAALAFKLDALPPPPARPLYGPWIDAIWEHFRSYREGRQALLPTAYMCLSLLEASVSGDRRKAAEFYGLEKKALAELGKLTSAVPDPQKGRKIVGTRPAELTPEQEKTIEGTLVDIVRAVVRKELE